MRAPNARDTALRVLVSCRTAGAWADAALRAQLRRDGLSGPEAALCSRIVYGVMQNRLLLDFYLGAYCSQKVDHLQPPLLEILRIGAYQILFLDKIPHSAAVNQAVEQAKDNGRAKAAGLVNAVLRQLSRNKVHLPRIPDQDALHSLSIRYSHPKWLVKRLQAILGPETEACLAADNAPAPLTIQVNPLKAAAEELTAELEASGVIVRPHPWVSGCLELDHVGDLTALEPFRMGKFLVQDPAARLVSQIAGVEPGMRVLDVCAAPGGKSFSAAFAMEDQGEILACDLHENKLKRIRVGAELELQLTLSVSLHAPDSETRSKIMPINRAYDVEELFRACHDYFDKTGRRISFEYAMIDGVNDHDWQADLIARKLRGMPGHVNLIPLNDVVESPYKPSRRIGAFQKRLESHGITATVRRSLGGDIDASCGQLRRKAMEEAQKGECSQ